MKAYVALFCLIGTLMSCNGQTLNCFEFPDGTIFDNPLVDTVYYVCMNGIPVPVECAAGYVFCAGGISCVSSCPTVSTTTTTAATTTLTTIPTTPTQTTTPSPVACSGQADGTLFADSSNCKGYYMCVGGKAVAGSCISNYSFSTTSGTCVAIPCAA